jgi:hypothetical protein
MIDAAQIKSLFCFPELSRNGRSFAIGYFLQIFRAAGENRSNNGLHLDGNLCFIEYRIKSEGEFGWSSTALDRPV